MEKPDAPGGKAPPRRFLPKGFWMGLWVGIGLMMAVISVNDRFQPKLRIGVAGQDVSHGDGAKIVLQDHYNRWTQTCVGGCDDLQVLGEHSTNVYTLTVIDAAGDLVFSDGIYVSGGMREDWQVSGRPKLKAKHTFLERTEGGDQAWPVEAYDR
jgi:hypothetical protein